jgi:hypothetical protein
MTKFWEDSSEVHAELHRQAMEELEQRGGVLAAVKRADWLRRLEDALRDGRDLAGAAAVRDALVQLTAKLGIAGARGAKRPALTKKQLNAARWAAEHLDSDKLTDGRLAQIAGMSPQNFGQTFGWRRGRRWPEFWGLVAALSSGQMQD